MDEVYSIVMLVQKIYTFMIIGYVLLSWLPNARESFIGVFLGKLVEPYLGIFRKFIPPIGGMLDLSPILAVFALQFVAYGLIAVIGFFI
ncbi:YggT family protein [Paenibacillus sp. FSL A5-0031]|jgi:YggT family protein|uniref:YggT family protein n=1 Tax=Bacillales TaxID=1385 RepID=UPI0006B566E9|nr:MULTISPECIES: YggT family protein [Bacillales]OME82971.1 YggT family protein [Paenibacillus sp. FSL A5-0031]